MNFTKKQIEQVRQHLHIEMPQNLVGMDLTELREMRTAAHRAGRDLLDSAQKENRNLTSEESGAFDTATAYIDSLDDEIEAIRSGDEPHLPDFPRKHITPMMGGDNSCRSLFGPPTGGTAGFRNLGEMLQAIESGDSDRLRELRNMAGGVGTTGGFAVPEIWWEEVWNSGVEASVALDRCTVFQMESDTLHVAGFDSEDHSNGPIANVAGSWLAEDTAASRVTPKMRQINYVANKLGIYIGITSEAMEDSAALSKSVAPMMTASLAFTLDEAILVGNGVAKPLGILNCPATIARGRGAANTIVFADLRGMLGRLLPTSLGNAVWVVSPSAFALLVGVEVASTTGHLAMSSTPGAGRLDMQLLGHPVRVSEKLPALGEKGDVMLADFSYYGLGLRSGGRLEKTNAAQWTSDVIDWRLLVRADGTGLVSKALTPAGGGDTLSPFVVLDA